MNPIVFTIVSSNYLAYAATLMQSVRRVMPKTKRYIFVCDEPVSVKLDCAAQIVPVSKIMGPVLADMVLRYSILEINTAVKPFIFRSFFEKVKTGPILYLDPDILVLSPLVEVLKALEGSYELVLTPHLTAPLDDDKEPSDHAIMKSGIWNLGFVALRAAPDTVRLVDWWCKKCETQCLSDVTNNMFTDQRWMDMAPAFVAASKLLMHPGYNVAYWNLPHRQIAFGKGKTWRVNQAYPLRFFHFSGIVPNDPSIVSKHQNRYQPEDLGDVSQLFDEYRSALLKNKWQELKALPYAYAYTKDMRRIADITRPYFRDLHPQSLASRFDDHQDALSWYVQWLFEPALEHPLGLPRIMVAVARARPDVARAFDNITVDGARAYAAWFKEKATIECSIAPEDVDAALAQVARGLAAPIAVSAPQGPSADAWFKSIARVERDVLLPLPARSELSDWLRTAVEVGQESCELPLAMLLPMCIRRDLRAHYSLSSTKDIFGYLVWLFSKGVREHYWSSGLTEVFFDVCSPVIQGYDPAIPSHRLLALGGGISPLVSVAAEQYDASFGQLTGDGAHWSSEENVARVLCFVYQNFLADGAFPCAVVTPVEAYLFGAHQGIKRSIALHVPVFAYVIWTVRSDLKALFPGNTRQSWLGLIGWYLIHGRLTYTPSVNLARYADFCAFLAAPSADLASFNNLQVAIFCARRDLASLMDVKTAAGRERLHEWLRFSAAREYYFDPELAQMLLYQGVPLPAIQPDAAAKPLPLAPGAKARIRLIGYFDLPTGRAEDARTVAAALESAGYEVEKIDRSETAKPDATHGREKAAIAIHVLNADTAYVDWVWREAVGAVGEINIGFWAWELETMPADWRYAYAFYDELWGNSQFCARALAGQDLRPVQTLPLAIAAMGTRNVAPLTLSQVPNNHFCFLFTFDFSSFHERKNPQGVVKAFERAFPAGSEAVALVIKTVNAEAAPLAWKQLSSRCAANKRITLLNESFTRSKMDALFERADAYVSLHRAEGFGRGLAEALLRGKPVIATAYSGSEEICRANTAYLVDFELVPIAPGEYLDDAVGLLWAEPNIDSAARAMREVVQHQAKAKARAQRGRKLVQQQYSVQAIGEQLDDYLQALLGDR